MASTTVSSTEFARHTNRVLTASSDGPVFITERGKDALVLMSVEHYQQLTNTVIATEDIPKSKI